MVRIYDFQNPLGVEYWKLHLQMSKVYRVPFILEAEENGFVLLEMFAAYLLHIYMKLPFVPGFLWWNWPLKWWTRPLLTGHGGAASNIYTLHNQSAYLEPPMIWSFGLWNWLFNHAGWWFWRFFMFIPIWGNYPKLTNIFQLGWNHQLACHVHQKLSIRYEDVCPIEIPPWRLTKPPLRSSPAIALSSGRPGFRSVTARLGHEKSQKGCFVIRG